MSARVVHKYPVTITDLSMLMLPVGAEVLHVGTQGTALYLWALVDPGAYYEAVQIAVVGTGNPVPAGDLEHLGSVQVDQWGTQLVWHVFKVVSP